MVFELALVIKLIIIGLATYRLARFIAHDDLIVEPRIWMSDKVFIYSPSGEIADYQPLGPDNWFGKTISFIRYKLAYLLTCALCLGFWIAVGMYLVIGTWAFVDALIFVLAVAGLQTFLQKRE